MPRKRKPKSEEGGGGETVPPAGRWVRPAVRVGLALLVVVGSVAGLAWLGGRAGLAVANRDRYVVRVADIRCDVPPGSDRLTFLTEVRYLADLPESVPSVDSATPERLRIAFASHPWVAAVEEVRVPPSGGIDVALRFRVPVLAVTAAGEPGPRAVDADGVLLPATAPTVGLADLTPILPTPTVTAGQPWPDPDVRRAAELAATFPTKSIDKTATGWRITQPDGKVLVVGR